MDDPFDKLLAFDPVPSASRRRDGWTAERQRDFIRALARCGSVTAAARQVGMSVRGAYGLRERDGSDGFAEAWDEAAQIGMDATRDCVIDRAMHGGWVPIVRRGRIVRMEYRAFDKLAMAILSGARTNVEDNRADRASIRAYRRELREEDRRRAQEEKRRKANAEAHRLIEERIRIEGPRKPLRTPPRIRTL